SHPAQPAPHAHSRLLRPRPTRQRSQAATRTCARLPLPFRPEQANLPPAEARNISKVFSRAAALEAIGRAAHAGRPPTASSRTCVARRGSVLPGSGSQPTARSVPLAAHISTAMRVKGLSTGGATQAKSERANGCGQDESASRRARLCAVASSGELLSSSVAHTRASHGVVLRSQSLAVDVSSVRLAKP